MSSQTSLTSPQGRNKVHLNLTYNCGPLSRNFVIKPTVTAKLLYLHGGCIYPDILFKTLTNSSDLEGKKQSRKNVEVEKDRGEDYVLWHLSLSGGLSPMNEELQENRCFSGRIFKKKQSKGNTSFIVPIICTKFGPLHLPVSSLKINTKLHLWLQRETLLV